MLIAVVLASSPTGGDWLMLVGICLILFVLTFLGAAEMGLSKMTKPKAAAMADQGLRSGREIGRAHV